MTEPTVTGLVLAGGRSSRFGRDKLAEPIDGRPLLWHAIDAVRPLRRRGARGRGARLGADPAAGRADRPRPGRLRRPADRPAGRASRGARRRWSWSSAATCRRWSATCWRRCWPSSTGTAGSTRSCSSPTVRPGPCRWPCGANRRSIATASLLDAGATPAAGAHRGARQPRHRVEGAGAPSIPTAGRCATSTAAPTWADRSCRAGHTKTSVGGNGGRRAFEGGGEG